MSPKTLWWSKREGSRRWLEVVLSKSLLEPFSNERN
jgi:hypothetical protein